MNPKERTEVKDAEAKSDKRDSEELQLHPKWKDHLKELLLPKYDDFDVFNDNGYTVPIEIQDPPKYSTPLRISPAKTPQNRDLGSVLVHFS